MNKWYVVGLVEGEGCFSLSLNKAPHLKLKWEARPLFSVGMDPKNEAMLRKMCQVLDLPQYTIRIIKRPIKENNLPTMIYCTTQKVEHLLKVVKFFNKYQFIGPKKNQFDVWKKGVILKSKHLNTTLEGMNQYLKLREEIHRCNKSKRKWNYNLEKLY